MLGSGHGLAIDPDTLEVFPTQPRLALEVDPGKTLALLGGFVTLDGGNLTALDGRVVLNGIGGNGLVALEEDALGWTTDLTAVSQLSSVGLFTASSVMTSGTGSGAVDIAGNFIDIDNGSTILANALDDGHSIGVDLQATEEINLIGSQFDANTGDAIFPTSIFAEVGFDAPGDGGDITLVAPLVLLADGAQISTSVFGSGRGGNLVVDAQDVALVGGTTEFGASGFFLNVADPFAPGTGGNLDLQTDRLTLAAGAVIDGTTFGPGDAGRIDILAQEINVVGGSADLGPSRIVSQVEDSGNGGVIALDTEHLNVLGGGELSTIVFGSGNGGNIDVFAHEINVEGTSPSGLFASKISSLLEEGSTGQGGNINLFTDRLSVTAGAGIDSSTVGTQTAGDINVQAQVIQLVGTDNFNTGLFATTETESVSAGGEINLKTDTLRVENGAQIVVGTRGVGDSRDLRITADAIVLDGRNNKARSGLFANALGDVGAGGTIVINVNDLLVQNGATINASNFSSRDTETVVGRGAAGNIDITAQSIELRKVVSGK